MTITDPAALHPAWAAAFNAKDIPAMTALGEDGYIFAITFADRMPAAENHQ